MGQKKTFKFLSWNVNGIRACSKQGLVPFIESLNADALSFQEIKAQATQCEEFVGQLEQTYGFEWHPAVRPGYSGVLGLFRSKPVTVQSGMGNILFDTEGRVLTSDHGEFYLVNLYFPNGGSGPVRHEYKMKFLDEILEYFKKLDSVKPVIMTGDFNIAHREIDVHDPVRLDGSSGFMPEEREWMSRFLDAGFVDTFRYLNPEKKDHYSWWSYRQGSRKRNKGWRIDYFFISERWKDRIEDCTIHKDIFGSDHCPLSLTLDFSS